MAETMNILDGSTFLVSKANGDIEAGPCHLRSSAPGFDSRSPDLLISGSSDFSFAPCSFVGERPDQSGSLEGWFLRTLLSRVDRLGLRRLSDQLHEH